MYLILTASKDNYITNKIIYSAYSATNANVGYASTLDIFRLYNESFLSGTTKTNELSRALIKFDYSKVQTLMKDTLDINSPSLECELQMFDIAAGQTTPVNFTLALFPLSQSFDEGVGKNVTAFSDLDTANFISASYSNNTLNPWHLSGADAQGVIDSTSATGYPTNIDIITSGNLGDGAGSRGLGVFQTFKDGSENLKMNVTTIVSATIAGKLPAHGFRLSFTGSEEKDTKTRFVKRFASRHVRNKQLQPRLVVSYDDTVFDNHRNFYFDLSGSLFLKNFHRGTPANIVSGSALTVVSGNNCILLTLRTGSFSKTITGSSHQAGTKFIDGPLGTYASFVTGVYSASFAVPSNISTVVDWGTTLAQMVARTGSVTLDEYWSSIDGSVGYHTGSVTFNRVDRTSFNVNPTRLDLIVTNAKNSYRPSEKALFRVFVRDFNAEQKKSKLPYSLKSVALGEVYYRVRDIESDYVYIPFKTNNNATRLSTDSDGMFFETYLDLPKGRTYTIDFLIREGGMEFIEEAKNVSFRVE